LHAVGLNTNQRSFSEVTNVDKPITEAQSGFSSTIDTTWVTGFEVFLIQGKLYILYIRWIQGPAAPIEPKLLVYDQYMKCYGGH
jgi:hypothetical protein